MSKVVLLVYMHRMFGGKLALDEQQNEVLLDCVEFMFVPHPQNGNIMSTGVILGTMITLPTDRVIVELTKNSPLYQTYYRTTANIEMPH